MVRLLSISPGVATPEARRPSSWSCAAWIKQQRLSSTQRTIVWREFAAVNVPDSCTRWHSSGRHFCLACRAKGTWHEGGNDQPRRGM
jgi:hypothetical protein